MTDHRHYDDHNTGPEWGTPVWIWEPLAEALGGFDLDPASGAESEPIAETRFTVSENGLKREWFGDAWLNPPYGRQLNPKWADKVCSEVENVDSLTALVPASTDTQWFQSSYATADTLTFIEGRVTFDGGGDNNASFPSVIATWGDVPPEYVDILHEHGFVTHRTDRNARFGNWENV